MKYTAAERAALIDRYEKGPTLLRAAFAKVPREAWNWRPGTGKWSVHEILGHCADAEANAAMRIRYLVAEEKPSIIGFDQDRWAKVLDYQATRVELALAAIDVMRSHTVDLLRRLPDEAWARRDAHGNWALFGAELARDLRRAPGDPRPSDRAHAVRLARRGNAAGDVTEG